MNILNAIFRQVTPSNKTANNNESIPKNTSVSGITTITNFSQFESAKIYWPNLLNNINNPSKLMSYDWINSNWIWNEAVGSPNIVLIYKAKELIAIFPMYIEYIKRKTVFKLMCNPLNPYNDALIKSEDADFALNALFQLLLEWGNYWDRLDLINLPPDSILLKAIQEKKPEEIPFKYKIKVKNPIRYIQLNDQLQTKSQNKTKTWDDWLSQQPISNKKDFNKINNLPTNLNNDLLFCADYEKINQELEETHNTLVKSLSEYLFNNSNIARFDKLTRLRIINSFVKRLGYYNKINKWIRPFNWSKDGYKNTSYFLLDRNNCYNVQGDVHNKTRLKLTKDDQLNYTALLLKSCFDHKISKFYLNQESKLYKKFWKLEKENRFQITIYNKSKKWF